MTLKSVKDLQLFTNDAYKQLWDTEAPEADEEQWFIDAKFGDTYKQLWGTEAPEADKEQWFINTNGAKVCLLNGDIHCSTGPAMFKNRTEFYYQHNMLHNLNGPAVIGHNGLGFVEYWIDGYEYNTKEAFDAKVKELALN